MSPENPDNLRRPRNWPSVRGDAQRRASYALTRLEDITRLVAEWVWEVDTEGRFTYVSERVTQDLGVLPGQLTGKRFSDIGQFTAKEPLPADHDATQANEPDWKAPFRDKAFEMVDTGGDVRRLLVSAVPIFEPETWKFEGACGTARDTTELRASRETKAYLEEANRLLREASDAKSAFLANMSHELRTPLNAILGFTQILSDQTFGPLGDQRYLDYAKDIQASGEHLVGLVNEVLDLSAIESGQLDLFETEVDVGEAIATYVEMLRQTADRKALKLETEVHPRLPPISADARSIRQILLNLISNALKFTNRGGSVKTSAAITDDGGIVLAVSDTGVGIPKRDLELVLKPFGRGTPAMTTNEHGMGLGLAITKSLVEKHGGELRLDSTVGEGTTVEVIFPSDRVLIRRD